MWSQEYSVVKGDIHLHAYRKRKSAPVSDQPLQVLFLVHGSTVSGRNTYDLQVPGRDDYSVMDHFANLGYDVWTLDHEGYGRSDWTEGSPCGVLEGVADLHAAIPYALAKSGVEQLFLFGSSSGALRASRFAAERPDVVLRLAISALVYTGAGSPTLAQRKTKLPEYTTSHRRAVNLAFYEGMFNRDKPGTSEALVPAAIAALELPIVAHVPTGTYVDMCSNLPLVDPKAIQCPTLVLRGEFDGIASDEDVLAFFAALPSKDKQFIALAGIAHNPMMGVHRGRFYHSLQSFLQMPF